MPQFFGPTGPRPRGGGVGASRSSSCWTGTRRLLTWSPRLASSLEDLVRTGQQRRRDRQAERLGGLQVDHQLELCRLLDGEIGGPRAFQDLGDVLGRVTKI